jgi:PAS domain S-box-containing protein
VVAQPAGWPPFTTCGWLPDPTQPHANGRRRGEARFGSLVRHASDLITVIGPDGTITYQSPSIERLLGYDPDDMSGRRFDVLLDPSDGNRVREMLADVAAAYRDSGRLP